MIEIEIAPAMHEISEFKSPHVRLPMPPGFTERHDAVRVQVGESLPGDIVDGNDYRVMTPLRSFVNIATDADEEQLTRAIADMVDAGVALRIERTPRN